MIGFLIFMLGTLLFLFYFIFGRTVTSPSCIFVFSLLISACVSFDLQDYYGLSICAETVAIIIVGAIVFSIGEYISGMFVKDKSYQLVIKPAFCVNKKLFLGYAILSVVVIIVLYQNMSGLASMIGGNNIDANKFLMYAEMAKSNDMSSSDIYPWWILLFQIINTAICFVAMYCITYNTIFFNFNNKDFPFILPILTYIIMSILMMSRSGLIELVIYGFTIVSILWIFKYGNDYANKKIIKYGFVLFITFLAIFFYMRFLRGDGNEFDLIEDIFAYAGSEIPGMNSYLQGDFQIKEPYDEYIGSHTLLGLYYGLNKIGIDIPAIPRAIQFVFFNNNGYTNVYTIFTRYLMDFGIVGTLLILSFLGSFYGYIHRYIHKNNELGFLLLLYSSIILVVYYSSISELFFSAVIHPIYISRLLLMYIFYRYMEKNRNI